MLYTASNGQRRVRINNIVSAITTTAKSTTNFADTDASVGIIVRDNLSRMPEYPLKELRLRMNDRLIDVLPPIVRRLILLFHLHNCLCR